MMVGERLYRAVLGEPDGSGGVLPTAWGTMASTLAEAREAMTGNPSVSVVIESKAACGAVERAGLDPGFFGLASRKAPGPK